MSLDKNTILIFTQCDGKQIIASNLPSIAKLKEKGTILSNIKCSGDFKQIAGAGNTSGETLWEATSKAGLIVGTLQEKCDLCIVDINADINVVEIELAKVLEVAGRNTLVVLIAQNAVIYYGTGIAKGKTVDKEYCICTVASTVAYIANLPVPENCEAGVCYCVLKDITLKMKEFVKLQSTITNMESAMERSTRQPWDKHDCA